MIDGNTARKLAESLGAELAILKAEVRRLHLSLGSVPRSFALDPHTLEVVKDQLGRLVSGEPTDNPDWRGSLEELVSLLSSWDGNTPFMRHLKKILVAPAALLDSNPEVEHHVG